MLKDIESYIERIREILGKELLEVEGKHSYKAGMTLGEILDDIVSIASDMAESLDEAESRVDELEEINKELKEGLDNEQ